MPVLPVLVFWTSIRFEFSKLHRPQALFVPVLKCCASVFFLEFDLSQADLQRTYGFTSKVFWAALALQVAWVQSWREVPSCCSLVHRCNARLRLNIFPTWFPVLCRSEIHGVGDRTAWVTVPVPGAWWLIPWRRCSGPEQPGGRHWPKPGLLQRTVGMACSVPSLAGK